MDRSHEEPFRRPGVEERYRALLEIARTLTATRGCDELYAAIHRETVRILPGTCFFIALRDPRGERTRIIYQADATGGRKLDVPVEGADADRLGAPRAIDSTAASFSDDTRSALLGPVPSRGTDGSAASIASAPLMHDGRTIGTIGILSSTVGAYEPEDLDLLQGIADIAAIAIDNARHVEEIERRRAEAERLEEIGRHLTRELDPRRVLGMVVTAAIELMELDGAAVWLCEEEGGLTCRVAESGGSVSLPLGLVWELGGPLEEALLVARDPFVIDDLAASEVIPDAVRDHLQEGSAAGVPIVVSDEVTGILTAGSKTRQRFGSEEAGVLRRLASQCAAALENARLHATLQALSLTDPLTGLPNRRRLQLHLEKEIPAAMRGRPTSVILFDIDNFKQLNDRFGHLVGDEVLRIFAGILMDENRAMNVVARYGGDEFVSILSDSDRDGARQYIARVADRVACEETLARYGTQVSIGLAEWDRTRMRTSEDLLEAADLDMYANKAQRRAARGVPPAP